MIEQRVSHTIDDRYDIDLAIALDLPIQAECGATFTPMFRGSETHEFPECLACHPPTTSHRGQPRVPHEIRSAFPHYVYRCYDELDLLYVGCTYSPPARLKQHRAEGKDWISAVARTRLVVFPDRRKALDMERLAIETEHPIHNRQFKTMSHRRPA